MKLQCHFFVVIPFNLKTITHIHIHIHIFVPCLPPVIVNRLSLEKYEVLWTADDFVYKQKKEIGSQLWSMVGEKLGKGPLYGATR